MAPLTPIRHVLDTLRAMRDALRVEPDRSSPFAAEALERHKREGMDLAVRARIGAMIVIAIMLPFLNPSLEMLYYEIPILGFILIGLAQRRVARVGRSRVEILLVWADLLLMTVTVALPNPFDPERLPLAMEFRDGGFVYFFVILALGTLAYSWRTLWGIGVMTAILWALTAIAIGLFARGEPEISAAIWEFFGDEERYAALLDPSSVLAFVRAQEIVVILIVAAILALSFRRFERLLLGHAALERERTNLARYFSPNVVEVLSQNDEPLKQVKTQDVAILFVDIVGFTRFAETLGPEEVIGTLRDFHGRMEAEVFRHEGTLDKYLGDGLMATFGTPVAGPRDATNALQCAQAMIAAMADWNRARGEAGQPPLLASFGLHFGPAVLGDIGSDRLEYAVIGNTVNVASRVEALTRTLDVELAATEELRARVLAEAGEAAPALAQLDRQTGQNLRGSNRSWTIWTQPRAA
ncbi:MAG: adenylate/guanylate cyclase domain-containing protein [Pseudomonadota bacterium]